MLRTKDFKIFTNKISLDEPVDSEFEINKKNLYSFGVKFISKGVIYRPVVLFFLSRVEPKKRNAVRAFSAKKREPKRIKKPF